MAKTKAKRVANKDWEAKLENFFTKKLPGLPKWLKELMVSWAPWVTIISVVLAIPAILVMMGWGGAFGGMMTTWRGNYWPGGMMYGARWGVGFGLASVAAGISLVLHIMAIDGLFKRSMVGWRLLFYSCLVQAAYHLLSFNVGGLLIGTGLSLYFLFQIKSYYK